MSLGNPPSAFLGAKVMPSVLTEGKEGYNSKDISVHNIPSVEIFQYKTLSQ